MLEDLYRVASNSTRRRILLSLTEGTKAFSELMRSVAMDPEHETGPFLYHVHRLEAMALVGSRDGYYYLTERGFEMSALLTEIHQTAHSYAKAQGPLILVPADPVPGDTRQSEVSCRANGGIPTKMELNRERSEPVIRLLEGQDVPDLLEILTPSPGPARDHMEKHLARSARGGLDMYTNNLVVELGGRVVGRVIVDTNYPPYSELAGLALHPSVTGRGLEGALVSHALGFAQEKGCSIQYTIVDRGNTIHHAAYSGSGFILAMERGFRDDDSEVCLFRFNKSNIPEEFEQIHPLAQPTLQRIGTGSTIAEARITWTDPLERDDFSELSVCVKGRRHLAMPRIYEESVNQGSTKISVRADEKPGRISPEKPAAYNLVVENHGDQPARLEHTLRLPPGIRAGHNPTEIVVNADEEETLVIDLEMEDAFDVPALSFTTVLVTSTIRLPETTTPIVCPLIVSAGFEKD